LKNTVGDEPSHSARKRVSELVVGLCDYLSRWRQKIYGCSSTAVAADVAHHLPPTFSAEAPR